MYGHQFHNYAFDIFIILVCLLVTKLSPIPTHGVTLNAFTLANWGKDNPCSVLKITIICQRATLKINHFLQLTHLLLFCHLAYLCSDAAKYYQLVWYWRWDESLSCYNRCKWILGCLFPDQYANYASIVFCHRSYTTQKIQGRDTAMPTEHTLLRQSLYPEKETFWSTELNML